MRPSKRQSDELRNIRITRRYTRHAEGAVLIEAGDTKVLCTVSVEDKVPPFLKGKGQGWLTAEYGMLPRATNTRGDREAARGKQSGRTQEIQRLIGRALRAVVDLNALGERTMQIDCDVIQADGGTRTASITGAFVAVQDAVSHLLGKNLIVLMRGHGETVVGPSIQETVVHAYYAEVNARLETGALRLGGGNITYLSPGEEANAAKSVGIGRPWDMFKAKIGNIE